MFAIADGCMEEVVLLLERGYHVNLQDIHGTSSLMLSCFFGHLPLTKLLLAHDADSTFKTKKESQPS